MLDLVKKLSLGERILGGAGVFLILDLLFLPWHRISVGIPGIARITESRSGLQSPNGFLGLLAFLVVAALVAHVVISEFTKMELPEIPVSWGQADLLGAAGVAVLLLLKLVMETDFLGFGAWLAILAAGVLVYGGFLRNQEMSTPSPL
ncbi:MAG TPA: hypothetical protein VGL92_06605 [Acidimicrobiia bacterium]|jgi:hypothetical protein